MTPTQSLEKINERHSIFLNLLNFFVAEGVKEISLSDSYSVAIVVCDWYGTGKNGREICEMVDLLIKKCPKYDDFFTLRRVCNVIWIEHKRIFTNEE